MNSCLLNKIQFITEKYICLLTTPCPPSADLPLLDQGGGKDTAGGLGGG